MKAHPKVFISHASEDKERFVIDFAKKLRSNGVDAWFDQWEIKPGDSLVDKIFEDGIKNMDIFIIILSQVSIKKPWVREELNASVVKKISKQIKIIPVLIDHDIEVPEALKSTVWVKIDDIDHYENEFKSILSAIFDNNEKPPLGSKPKFALPSIQINGLSKIDSLILLTLGDLAYENNEAHLSPDQIKNLEKRLELSTEQINESLEILENHYYVQIKHLMGSKFPIIEITTNGIITYGEHNIENFSQLFKEIIHLILNEQIRDSHELTTKTDTKTILIEAILNHFISMGYVDAVHLIPSRIRIHNITASGKRYFREVLEGTEQ